ncbi:unnamed protein product [Protopolystoma xenopodis]|uniref:Uncharacterized protein n=1 Tax=Protopolystoma xenopodis TaxID=117903 RepID=A0A3S5FBP9_9PLAT|nr:unnamed protein product [Protopolystoma xenopodis]
MIASRTKGLGCVGGGGKQGQIVKGNLHVSAGIVTMPATCNHRRYREMNSALRRTQSFPSSSRPFRLYPLPKYNSANAVCARCLTMRGKSKVLDSNWNLNRLKSTTGEGSTFGTDQGHNNGTTMKDRLNSLFLFDQPLDCHQAILNSKTADRPAYPALNGRPPNLTRAADQNEAQKNGSREARKRSKQAAESGEEFEEKKTVGSPGRIGSPVVGKSWSRVRIKHSGSRPSSPNVDITLGADNWYPDSDLLETEVEVKVSSSFLSQGL